MRQVRHADLIAAERALLLRGSLVDLIKLTWRLVEKVKPYIHNWHIDATAEMLTALYMRQIDNLRISIPPGHMKSLIVNVFWPIYVWLRSPGDRFMMVSYDGSLTARDSQRVLDVYESDWWRERVPEFTLKREGGRAPGKKLFENVYGGWRMATSIEGKAVGNHVDWMAIDDPNKPRGLTNKKLQNTADWYTGTAATRLTRPGKGKVLAMQRLHEKDLASLTEEDPSFYHLVLPAHFKASHPFVYIHDPRKEGDLLWPEYRDEEALAKLARDLGGDRHAQLEQDPRSDRTRIFPTSFFDEGKRWTDKHLPEEGFDTTVISLDAAFKDKPDSDDVAIAVISTKGPFRYLRKVIAAKLSFTSTLNVLLEVSKEFPEASAILIEDKANGPALINVLSSYIGGIVPIEPQGSKLARAHACTHIMQSGHFLTPSDEVAHAYMPEVIDQMTAFPMAAHDDIVDAITQALNWLSMNSSNAIEALIAAGQERLRQQAAASQNATVRPVNPLAEMLKAR